MKNDYSKAIQQLEDLKTKYTEPEHNTQLKHHSKIIIDNYANEELKNQFAGLTTFRTTSHPQDRRTKILIAIDTAIRDFQIKEARINSDVIRLSSQEETKIEKDIAGKLKFYQDKIIYFLSYLILIAIIIAYSNYDLMKQLNITFYQVLIFISIPCIFIIGKILLKIPERWFAISLGLILVILDKVLSKI
jgi:hypothetical protein